MSLAPTRFLIELGSLPLPEPHYLHLFEVEGEARTDAGHDWLPDPTRALRFATREDAEAFGGLHLEVAFRATEHRAADLVGAEHSEAEDQDEDLVA